MSAEAVSAEAFSAVAATYNPIVTALFTALNHAGELADTHDVRHGEAGSRAQGAVIRLWLQIADAQIIKARFQAYGCPHFLAAAELLTRWLEGRSVQQAMHWSWKGTEAELAVPADKRSKLLLLEDALRRALVTD